MPARARCVLVAARGGKRRTPARQRTHLAADKAPRCRCSARLATSSGAAQADASGTGTLAGTQRPAPQSGGGDQCDGIGQAPKPARASRRGLTRQ